jgi:hypothetical protein
VTYVMGANLQCLLPTWRQEHKLTPFALVEGTRITYPPEATMTKKPDLPPRPARFQHGMPNREIPPGSDLARKPVFVCSPRFPRSRSEVGP